MACIVRKRSRTPPNVRQRLDRLINLLEEGSSARADDLIEVVGGLLDHDIVGEALGSLLTPAYRNDPHLRTLSPPALEERRLTLLAATKALQSNFHSTYAARRGANADLYKDRFIQRMDEIAEKAGLKRSPMRIVTSERIGKRRLYDG